mgnify:FL=1
MPRCCLGVAGACYRAIWPVASILAAALIGCALAQPIAPNATAGNTAPNTAQANPAVSVSVPAQPPAAAQPRTSP